MKVWAERNGDKFHVGGIYQDRSKYWNLNWSGRATEVSIRVLNVCLGERLGQGWKWGWEE